VTQVVGTHAGSTDRRGERAEDLPAPVRPIVIAPQPTAALREDELISLRPSTRQSPRGEVRGEWCKKRTERVRPVFVVFGPSSLWARSMSRGWSRISSRQTFVSKSTRGTSGILGESSILLQSSVIVISFCLPITASRSAGLRE
jgi:hypothetical protein